MKENNKVSIFGKFLGKKNESEFTAEKAWIESTYGENSYKDIKIRINEKQEYIKSSIENKYKKVYQNGFISYSSYHCIIDIEEDLASFVDVIFEPFIKSKFTIINLSDRIDEIDEPHVYLISWKNAFKSKKDIVENKEHIELLEE